MYHWWAPAEALKVFDVTARPIVQMGDGDKVAMFKPGFTNFLPKEYKKLRQRAYIWRIFEKNYPTIEDWVSEVQRNGDICCWMPQKGMVEDWLRRQYRVFLAHERGFEDVSGRKLPVLFGEFMPAEIRYVLAANTPFDRADQIDKYGATKGGKLKPYKVTILNPDVPRAFRALNLENAFYERLKKR